MKPARILIVDDAATIRHALARLIADEPGLEVAGLAPDGMVGLEKVDALRPDLVILDVEMPVLDGIATLAAIRKADPRLPVVMFSTLTGRGTPKTLEALALGASDCVCKPPASGGPEAAMAYLRGELLPRLWALVGDREPSRPAARADCGGPPIATRAQAVELVVIGVSTGGPNALATVVAGLPASLPVPILVVQHMPGTFLGSLADRLRSLGTLPVGLASECAAPRPGEILIAPADRHLTVRRGADGLRLRLVDGPPENSCKPAADVLFRSAAEAVGSGGLGVVLTGMGRDGLEGSRAIRQAGGTILAQDEATSVVWGMPGAVVGAGLADAVLPLACVAPEIVRRVRPARPC